MAGIVLAGGRSTRMGVDKAGLPYSGTTLLAHVATALASVLGTVVIVVARAPERYSVLGARVVADAWPGAGPLGGIATGLRALPEGHHVAAACDMPHLRPEVTQVLLEAARGWDAAVPVVGGRRQPLLAAYHTDCLPAFVAAIAEGRLAVHAALEAVRLREVCEDELRSVDPDLRSFTNLNTPEDYHRAASKGETT
ncbi:MAG: molybdenum cofactor guanylyltransferase [Chthonomonadales bacterium]|nr:molybdenum cofactor guanylyltransferase [Chthonomonadales bacterium]